MILDRRGFVAPQPQGTVIVTVEGKLVRRIEATRTILDVLDLP